MSTEKRKFAVFDIDGTYFRFHLYWEMNLALARAGKLHPKINKVALELYDSWKRRENAKAFEAFDLGIVEKINELIHEINPANYDELLEKTLTPLLDRTYVYPRKLKEKLQKEGYMILAISGSRQEEVELFAKHHNFDDWVGQTWHRSTDGLHFTGEVTSTYKDKHLILESLVKRHNLTYEGSYGLGDTGNDVSMLETVENPIAINPNHSLLEEAKKRGWKIVVERKSIAYTLEPRDGSYILV